MSTASPGPPNGPRAGDGNGGPVLAAVDIGTNSVHMVIARVGDEGRMEILEREKEMVRLGRSGGDMKYLADDAIERGVAALARCRRVADAHGAVLAAVATSAVREAENRREFLDRAYDEAGVSVEVISGFEEARLIHLGVLQALPLFDQRMLLCDIGGGSTEVLLGRQGDVLASRSFRLGAIRLTERFFTKATIKPKHVARCRQHVEAMVAGFAQEVAAAGPDGGFDVAVGASGTIETVVAMACAARGDSDGARTLNGQRVTAAEIGAAVQMLVDTPDPDDRAKLPGVDPKRADILLAGAIILEQFVAAFGVDELVFSDYALREGVLLDQARRRSGATLHHLRDLRRRSVVHLMELTDEHPEHSREIARHALGLFDELEPLLAERLHGESAAARELLEAAALLCNTGVFISHSGHHKHSYYVIRNSEHLAGFTDREIEIIAQVARYHRKSAPKKSHPEWRALRRDDRDLVVALAAVLRVAIGLDRSHGSRVKDVRATWTDDRVDIAVQATGDDPIDLEIHSAELRRSLLEQVLGRAVELS